MLKKPTVKAVGFFHEGEIGGSAFANAFRTAMADKGGEGEKKRPTA
jgi:hypothetical protein